MKRIFSGIQPTGEIHLGNYVGAIRNWVTLTDEYDCIFCVVDYHAITVEYEIAEFRKRTIETALILLACGLSPEKCKIFVQSHVPEHTELAWIFNCVTPIGELERMTQFKDKSKQHRANINMGLMGYPVLQAADILIYKAGFVPVGEDQVQHIELSREVARKFNARFGDVFPEPQALLSISPKILGVDGEAKMSKTLNNYIGLLEDEGAMWEKLRTAVTDVNRVRRADPGNPEICNIYTIHRAFSENQILLDVDKGCRTAGIGCIDCKKMLFKNMIAELGPIREKALLLMEDTDYVIDVIKAGARDCGAIAKATMAETRSALGVLV
ncbi:MAG: Tryptophan--tRNA ligase [Syntrophorhabdus sp. PtaU1.Bin002]|nr:MAG: Tryptophan--tRNA ligase [Syntrophorhabdus sp. PtaB.Bin006]OPY65700.1 MAG: Tryptophan--tRNA ligase [Syntrophorhabdus sp. PtaU1.Bin002]